MIEGIDISHWQGVIDWAKAKAKGVAFVVIRAGSIDNNTGVCYTDYQFEANIKGAEAQGIPYALYWFFRPNHSAVKQAEYFLNLAAKANLGQLAVDLWCDIEVAGRADVVKSFCELLDNSGLIVGIYTNPNTALYLLTGDKAWMQTYDLWLADWTAPANVPTPWTEYSIWQYGVLNDGLEYGCQSKGLDHNRAEDWMVVPPPPPPPVDDHEERITQLEADVLGLKASHNDVVDDLEALNFQLTALATRVASLEVAPAPQPTGATFRIGDSQALARCVGDTNAAGRPIMVIFPRDNAPAAERIKWVSGTLLKVNPTAVTADGGGKYFALTDYPGKYVRAIDGVLTVGG